MMDCKNCIKNDVCGKMAVIQKNIEKLNVNAEYQSLLKEKVRIDMSCSNYARVQSTRILGGQSHELYKQ